MMLKEFIKAHRIPIILAVILIATFLVISFFKTYSETLTSDAWDGVVARSFSGGTGTKENPYLIASASEYAYLKSVLESDDATIYADKNYSITKSFNFGEFDASIKNKVPFSGVIDGNGNEISNFTLTGSIIDNVDKGTIKNFKYTDGKFSVDENSGIFSNSLNESNIEFIIVEGNYEETINDEEDSTNLIAGLALEDRDSKISNVVLNIDIPKELTKTNYVSLIDKCEDTTFNNVLVRKGYKYFSDDLKTDNIYDFEIENGNILIDDKIIKKFTTDNYGVSIENNSFILNKKELKEETPDVVETIPEEKEEVKAPQGPLRAPSKSAVLSDSITEHASGSVGNTLYINDLTADDNYLTGLNYAKIHNQYIPSGISTGYYSNENRVKVEIIYDGVDANNASLIGALSPINNETTNKFIYFKYLPLERDADGTLKTNINGDNYIRIELIDNPFTKRPYVNSKEYGFNGWVCNPSDSTSGLCDNSTFTFNKDNYTRYLDIPVNGGSELIIHLNASWTPADVVTSSYDISGFNNMSMQLAGTFSHYTTETITGNAVWKQDYTVMEYTRSYVRSDGYMPAGIWYKTNRNGTTYTYVAWNNSTRCRRNTTCYAYTANTSGIVSGSQYNGGSVRIVPNFNDDGNNTEITVNGYNANYMSIVEDPNGSYTDTVQVPHYNSYFSSGDNASGYYYIVYNPTNDMINTREYYTSEGLLCTSASNCPTAYKLIHYNDSLTNGNGNSIATIESVNNEIYDANKYYYLVTRDTNIFRYTSTTALSFSNLEVNRPFTVTGTTVNGTSATGLLEYPSSGGWFFNTYSDFQAANDIVIENIKIDGPDTAGTDNTALGGDSKTSQVIYANSHNLKIGRNVSSSDNANYLIAESVFGGTNNSVSGTFKVIIESGNYYAYHSGSMSGTTDTTLNETTIFGCDYDRIKNLNNNLRFNIGLDGYAGGHNNAGSDSLFASYNIVKSGTLGYNSDGTPNSDNTSGMYIGGRASTCVNSLTGAKIEGGNINTIVGGYGYNGTSDTNSTYIGMSGGTVREIYGGAGHSTTLGNRIINVTGGTVKYSVLGGSDSYSSTDTDDGVVQGSTLVYVGGTAIIGDGSTDELNGVESGSVFGAGGGKDPGNDSTTTKGTVYNSHVIINGGTINKSVYGGGNFGSTGTQSNSSASTVIDIISGTIGAVYGGSKSAGFSKSDYANASTIDINVSGGTIGYIYGGSNTKGTIYGSVDMDITGGVINNNIYGGGYGSSTFVSNNVDLTIGVSSVSGTPRITGNVYGGSAEGTVNSTSTSGSAGGNTTVTVNNGIITGSVFGGGQGSSTQTPYVLGNITVDINGGDIGSVFGGNDQAGLHTKQNEVNLNGGIVANAYGGGNRSSVTNTHVNLNGASVTNLYGGSNTLGDVTSTDVNIQSGSVQNVYGGNNEGGTCNTTDVDVTGTATITGAIYGGGNEVSTPTTNVVLNSANGTIPNVYGGGNSASVTTSNITNNGVSVTNIFGGSNSSGTVTTANITNNSGTVTNIYGGNNEGGNTVASHIDFKNGNATNIYGGGNKANGGTSDIIIRNGTVQNTFGGGNSAGLTSSSVHVINGNLTNVYGGSNNSGLVSTTNIQIDNTSNTVAAVYGGGNKAQVGDINVTIDDGHFTNVYGGGNLARANGDVLLDINGGSFDTNIYGGGNFGAVSGSTEVTITDATILGSAYAGGNGVTATVEGGTTITVDGNTIVGTTSSLAPHSGSVFGGGNQAYTGTENNNVTSTVNIAGGTFYGNIYGGANTSVIYGNTNVNIGNSALGNSTSKSDIYIKGHVFGGGEANASGSENYDWFFISVTEGTNIIVDGTDYNDLTIGGSFYGGGNASSASGESYLLIKNYGTRNNPKYNISIQRVDYATIDHSAILLKGAIDRANEYDKELFSISRVQNLKIKNNTDLYFEHGANLLEQFESLDNNNNYAVVTIDEDNNTLTKTVDNRVYVYEGRNINIAHDQQATDYGRVIGMSFLGIFNYDNDNKINTGIYDSSYNPGDTLDWSGTFSHGSYVLGSHEANHDIKIDGFYSHFMNEETAVNEVKYVDPTPKSGPFYMWFIGENVLELNVNLSASKYSTLGSLEFSFLDFSKPNTSFQILSFDSSDIAEGVSLVDKNSIPRIASSSSDANNIFGLSIESSNSGWLTSGKTSFYTREPSMSGTTYYEGENSDVVPTLLFYLYHSKNISEEKDLGTVYISVMSITKINAIQNEVRRMVINVHMSTAMFQTNEYEGAMTPGDKYELFTSTNNNITTKSKLSAYYALYGANTNLYQNGYHRALSSSYVLPVGTKITMLDFVHGIPEYYYHVIDQTDYNNAISEYNIEGECSYALSMFTKMGSKSNNSNYDDATQNAIYYNNGNSSEEFIFIVDFGDTQINENQLNNTLLIEMRDANEETIITVLGMQHSQMTYSLYANSDAQIEVTPTPSDNPLYIGYTDIFDLVIGYQGMSQNGVSVTDTQYFDSKLGVQVYLKNNQGNVISGTDLTGTYFQIEGTKYYPDINGYTHIKLADKPGNTEKWLLFNTENSTLASGDYTFVFETFASPDGIYYSKGNPTISNVPITIISSVYGLNPILDDESVIFSANNDKNLKFNIDYTSMLDNPNIRLSMYRRNYGSVYDTSYSLVDLQDYIDQPLFATTNEKEYLLIDNPNATNEFTLLMKNELLTGTYRLVFKLYDNDTQIGEIIRYIIIK